jgi:hypothetical protein
VWSFLLNWKTHFSNSSGKNRWSTRHHTSWQKQQRARREKLLLGNIVAVDWRQVSHQTKIVNRVAAWQRCCCNNEDKLVTDPRKGAGSPGEVEISSSTSLGTSIHAAIAARVEVTVAAHVEPLKSNATNTMEPSHCARQRCLPFLLWSLPWVHVVLMAAHAAQVIKSTEIFLAWHQSMGGAREKMDLPESAQVGCSTGHSF